MMPSSSTSPSSLTRAQWLRAMLAVLALGGATCVGATPNATEAQLIDALIDHVAHQDQIRFVRNGDAHPAAEAAEHMRAKYKHFRSEIVTADDFIARCATRSEVTGRRYEIRFPDGRQRDAAAYLGEVLQGLRTKR